MVTMNNFVDQMKVLILNNRKNRVKTFTELLTFLLFILESKQDYLHGNPSHLSFFLTSQGEKWLSNRKEYVLGIFKKTVF